MGDTNRIDPSGRGSAPDTLGEVLYAGSAKRLVPEEQWAALVRSAAAGDQPALHGLYERARRPVFTLVVRITGNRETAEEVTLDVFLEVWRRAGSYEPANGTVLGWIMNQARSRAIDRVRYETRAKRSDPGAGDHDEADSGLDPRALLESKQQGVVVRAALEVLTPDERNAIESAYFAERTHAEVAKQLSEPLGTVKTRIRSALRKLRRVISQETTP
jgi:RNA polymerase sigma-70 factor (ECF subfamily)